MPTREHITEYLRGIPQLESRCRVLPQLEYDRVFHELKLKFFDGKGEADAARVALRRNTRDDSPDEVRMFLEQLPVARVEQCYVLWCRDDTGIAVRWDDFVQTYDDLWYPSRDDLWVSNQSLDWLLDLDHEELFTFRR